MTNERREYLRGLLNHRAHQWMLGYGEVRSITNELLEGWDDERAEVLKVLRLVIESEWMLSHDWGGDRNAVLATINAIIARIEGKP